MHQRNYRQVVICHLVQNRKRETSEESAADRSRNQVPSLRIGDNLRQRMLHLTYEIRAQLMLHLEQPSERFQTQQQAAGHFVGSQ